jgi:hypothetical protein
MPVSDFSSWWGFSFSLCRTLDVANASILQKLGIAGQSFPWLGRQANIREIIQRPFTKAKAKRSEMKQIQRKWKEPTTGKTVWTRIESM